MAARGSQPRTGDAVADGLRVVVVEQPPQAVGFPQGGRAEGEIHYGGGREKTARLVAPPPAAAAAPPGSTLGIGLVRVRGACSRPWRWRRRKACHRRQEQPSQRGSQYSSGETRPRAWALLRRQTVSPPRRQRRPRAPPWCPAESSGSRGSRHGSPRHRRPLQMVDVARDKAAS